MYNPVHFRIDDIAKIRQFIQANPLATIVATQAEHSEICPVPLVWLDDGSEFGCLIGHVARPNPLIKMADIPTWQVQFLHTGHYISPNWYPSKAQTHKEVPTWNYQTVHLTVTPTLYTDAKMLTHIVGTMTDYFEQQFNQPPDTPWSLQDAPADYIESMFRAIVGFKLSIQQVEAKFKLSQNKSLDNRQGVIDGLTRLQTAEASAMIQLLTDNN